MKCTKKTTIVISSLFKCGFAIAVVLVLLQISTTLVSNRTAREENRREIELLKQRVESLENAKQ